MKRCGFVVQVSQSQRFAAADVGCRCPYQHPIHDDAVTGSQVARREFVLRGDIRHKAVGFANESHLIALPQVSQRNEDVVPGIELEEPLQFVVSAIRIGAPCKSRHLL